MSTLLSPPEIIDATRREFLAALGAAGLIAGCGTGTVAPETITTRGRRRDRPLCRHPRRPPSTPSRAR